MATNKIILQRTYKCFDDALRVIKDKNYIYKECENNVSRGIGGRDNGYEESWHGTKTFEEAMQLAYYGWPEGLKIIHENFSKYRNVFEDLLPQQDVRKEMYHDTHGEDIDIVRAIEGIPENMLSYHDSEEQIKVISGNKLQRIVVQCVYNSGITPETIALNGALLTILAEQYNIHGFRSELIYRQSVSQGYGSSGDGKSKLLNIDITIKRFDESSDFNKIAFMLTHPSMLRRVIFALEEAEPLALRLEFGFTSVGGYGKCEDYKEDTLVDPNTLYIPQINSNMPLATMVQHYRNLVANHFAILLTSEWSSSSSTGNN